MDPRRRVAQAAFPGKKPSPDEGAGVYPIHICMVVLIAGNFGLVLMLVVIISGAIEALDKVTERITQLPSIDYVGDFDRVRAFIKDWQKTMDTLVDHEWIQFTKTLENRTGSQEILNIMEENLRARVTEERECIKEPVDLILKLQPLIKPLYPSQFHDFLSETSELTRKFNCEPKDWTGPLPKPSTTEFIQYF